MHVKQKLVCRIETSRRYLLFRKVIIVSECVGFNVPLDTL